MHIHIATFGNGKEPVLRTVNSISGIDVAYLLHTREHACDASSVADMLGNLGIQTYTIQIDGEDFQEIVTAIYSIFERHRNPGAEFSINVSGGTNLMSAATGSCAFFIGASIYNASLRDGKWTVTKVPAPKIRDFSNLSFKAVSILLFIEEMTRSGKAVCNKDVSNRFDVQKQNSGYYLNMLSDLGLIEISKGYRTESGKLDKRRNSITITGQGRLIACWLKDE